MRSSRTSSDAAIDVPQLNDFGGSKAPIDEAIVAVNDPAYENDCGNIEGSNRQKSPRDKLMASARMPIAKAVPDCVDDRTVKVESAKEKSATNARTSERVQLLTTDKESVRAVWAAARMASAQAVPDAGISISR